jgi:hypothetical protein
MIPDDDLHQQPAPSGGPGGGKHAPEPLFDDRVGEPGARTPIPKANPTWREMIAIWSLAALIVLTIIAVHPEPPPNPTVNISKAMRALPDRPALRLAPEGDELVPCSDPARAHEKC